MNLFTKQKQTHRLRKQTYNYQRGKGRRVNQESGVNIYTLLYIKQITNKVLLYSTENYAQYFTITYKGKNMRNDICVYAYKAETLCCTPEANTAL